MKIAIFCYFKIAILNIKSEYLHYIYTRHRMSTNLPARNRFRVSKKRNAIFYIKWNLFEMCVLLVTVSAYIVDDL